jgi:hypothetical protein
MSARDLAAMSAGDFAPHVGEPFVLTRAGAPALELVLAAAEDLPASGSSPSGRTPFALTFDGPAEPLLAQQIVPLEHPSLGRLELFVVPVAHGAGGARYEAVFN